MSQPGGLPAAPSAFARLTTPAGLTHQPGLEGLRGVAVVAIVGFHLGLGVFRGAYFSLTLFFTLSGVLIGTLLLHELTTTGGFSIRRFWGRRARRLLPAALVTLAVLAVARHVTSRLVNTTGTEIAAATLDVANWAFIIDRQSYADLFGAPSAVLHFWSLSVEEQFYLAVGLAFLLLAWRPPRRPVFVVGMGASIIAAVSFLLPFVTDWSVDRVYYGTDTRAGELMVGVAMAAWFASPRRRGWLIERSRLMGLVALVGAAGMITLWTTIDPGTTGITTGLLPLAAALSGLIIVGALMPSGPIAMVTAVPVLGWLGRLSYCWSLVHWPVIVIADQMTDDRSLLRAAGLACGTLLLAQVVSLTVERPVRFGRFWKGRTGAWRLATSSLVVLGIIGAGIGPDGRRSASADLLGRLGDAVPVAAVDPAGSVPPTDLPRVSMFGDSVAFSLVMSMGTASEDPEFEWAGPETDIGCGIALSPWPPPEEPGRCNDPAGRYAALARQEQTDVALMFSCQWELLRQRIPGDDEARAVGDPLLDGYIVSMFDSITDSLRSAGVQRVLWTRCPYSSRAVGTEGVADALMAARDPERTDHFNELIDDFAASRDDVTVLPFDAWMRDHVDDPAIRPDGSHFEFATPNPASDELIRLVNQALTA